MKSALDQLRAMTVVVADTGSPSAVRKYRPIDCTTNPSLVLSAIKDPETEDLLERELGDGKRAGLSPEQIAGRLTVALGAELVPLIPGRVSSEVEAHLSFNTHGTILRAREIVAEYESRGISRERILVKMAASWEGIRAAEVLQAEGIDCNLTLLFAFPQAVACAAAGVYLISPFVGRITDWYKNAQGVSAYAPEDDPGVKSVRQIFEHYKANNVGTIVMGASFRSVGQIKALAGCDRLTISPQLLEEMALDFSPVSRVLSTEVQTGNKMQAISESDFRLAMNADAMATEKLAEGIRGFDRDYRTLVSMIASRT